MRFELATLHTRAGRIEEVVRILEESYAIWSDSIPMVEMLESLMIRRGDDKRSSELSDRIWRLEEIHSRR